jgi:hypothetical protein
MESILIAKIEVPGIYSSAGIVKALRNNFKEVYEFNYQNIMFNEGAEGMRRRLMGMCMMYSPDVVFLHIQNPEPLDMNLIQFLSEKTFVVLYTFDVRENIDWYKEYAPYVGLILFGDLGSIIEMENTGIDNVDHLQSSADFDLYKPGESGKDYGEIIFIGNNFVGTNLNYPLAQQRVDMVNLMKKHFGERFKVYGIGWPGSKMLNVNEEIEAYRSCKVAITHNNFDRKGYTSDRLWRAIGCGACTLSQYYTGYFYDFPSAAWEYWESFNHLIYQCEGILMDEELRLFTASSQHLHVINNHSWNDRILKLKKLIINHGYDKRMEAITKRAASNETPV